MAHGADRPWLWLPVAIAVVLFQGVAVLALVLTGSWATQPPGFLAAINPIVGLVGGTEGLAIVPQTMFDSFSSGTQWFQASNAFVCAALQWLGLGLVIDPVLKLA